MSCNCVVNVNNNNLGLLRSLHLNRLSHLTFIAPGSLLRPPSWPQAPGWEPLATITSTQNKIATFLPHGWHTWNKFTHLHISLYSIVIDDCFKNTEEVRKETVRKCLESFVLSDKKTHILFCYKNVKVLLLLKSLLMNRLENLTTVETCSPWGFSC